MNTLTKLFSRHFYRSFSFWAGFLLLLYTLFGFLILPKLITTTIKEQISASLGWQTSIEKIDVNPFLMTLTIQQLSSYENEKVTISLERFHADFELRSIVERAFTFKNIELIAPHFSLAIDATGSTSIQKALLAHQKPAINVKDENEKQQGIPKLLFDNIKVENGSLAISDNSQGQLINHNITPISFKLKAFSTYIEQGGDYQLQLALENNQSLQWRGNIAVSPIASKGSFTIQGIRLHRFWPYIKAYSPYELRHSEIDLSANYALSYTDQQLQLSLNDALISLKQVQIADPSKQQHFVDVQQILIGPSQFDLVKQSLDIEKIEVNAINLDLIRDNNGELELLAPLSLFNAQKTPSTETSGTASPFHWSIADININNSTLQFTDNSPSDKVDIKVHNIDARLSALNNTLANQQPFSLSYQVENSNNNSVSGEMVLSPFNLKSNIKLSHLPINIIQPYLSQIARVEVKEGKFSLDGKVQLMQAPSSEISGSFNGRVNIEQFNSWDTLNQRRLLGWEQLTVSPIAIDLSPLRIDIKKVALNKPYSRLIIDQDRKVNFSQLLLQQPTTQEKPPSTDNASTEIEIAEITFTDGDAYFADLSLIPQFGTSIQKLNGYIKGLSSTSNKNADVDITGRVEEYGKVAVKGEINPLAEQLYADMSVNFDKIELTTLTPYSGRYAGYVIDKGKLSLDLNYQIAQGFLNGSNRLILDQFELGDKVDSDESVDLPIKLALALFKDSDGIIDISLPTKGDMNSPDFEIGGLVMKALLNVMTKAIASPFSLLANLAGDDEQALNSVSFELGSAALTSEQKSNLQTLATLLTGRPQLILEVRVNVDSVLETQQLQRQALTQKLGFVDQDAQQKIKKMEALLIALKDIEAVNTIKAKLLVAQDSQQKVDEKQFQQQYQQLLFDQLALLQPIETLQLSELAQQRISVIKNELITVNNVDNQQIFALNPSLKGSAEGTMITTTFSLNSK